MSKEQDISDAAYRQGYEDCLTAYAWWRDGKQCLALAGHDLKKAIESMESTYNFHIPKVEPCEN